MIKNYSTKQIKIKPEKRVLSHYPNSRKRVNSNLYKNYRLMLKIYVISKNDIILKKQIKSKALVLKQKKANPKLVPYVLELITIPVNAYLFKVNKVKTRIFSAIEISYQSLIG